MALRVYLKCLCLLIFLPACTDKTTEGPSSQDWEFIQVIRDATIKDAIIDQYVYQWDARPPQEPDMAVDAGLLIVCQRAGEREDCIIPGTTRSPR